MEMHKAKSDRAIFDSVSVICRYPSQVLILKSTKIVAQLRGRRAGLSSRLVDQRQSREFVGFCANVARFASGDERFRADVEQKRNDAQGHLSQMSRNTADLMEDYSQFQSQFSQAQIKRIRQGREFDLDTLKKFLAMVSMMAGSLHEQHPDTRNWPTEAEWPNTLIYRFALFQGLHFLDWIESGSAPKIGADRIRNDIVDLMFATYATYFDGLLTRDKKLESLYFQGRWILYEFLLPMSQTKHRP